MLNLSSIKSYMYCPRKYFIEKEVLDGKKEPNLFYNNVKNLKIDINDLIYKNLRKIKQQMTLEEIEATLSDNIDSYIKNSFNILESNESIPDAKIKQTYYELTSQLEFDTKILALKSKKVMELLNKDGNAIVEMFFPSSMHSYFMKDSELDIIGVCDKIEIIDGIYYPILYKNGAPPLKGVWDSDAIEIAAHSLLIEQEFDTEVFVGFVEYVKIGQRRPVVMNVNIRKGLFNVIHEINELKICRNAPKVKINKNKCSKCEYENICLEEN